MMKMLETIPMERPEEEGNDRMGDLIEEERALICMDKKSFVLE